MAKQAELVQSIEELFQTLDQEVAKGVSFEFVEVLNQELKAQYNQICNLKSARGVRAEKTALLSELEKLVVTVQYTYIAESGDKSNIPAWAKNTDKIEAILFYTTLLGELKNLPAARWKIIFYYRGNEISFYEDLLEKIKDIENHKGTREDYLTLLNIRRSLISTLCLLRRRLSEVIK